MIDVAEIKIRAGDGGDGHVSFRREKFIAKGGPDGGDGGNGGSVYLVADNNLATLRDFKAKPVFIAPSGEPGGKKIMFGKSGEDLYVKVPVGTLVYELRPEGEILIADLANNNESVLIARGGIGGKGNYRFKSSVNTTPRQYTPGTRGEEKTLKLEIKLVADVGLVGFPNSGKSTLINFLTKAKAKVADYPFTTLSPNLGTCRLKNGRDIVIADIPGLIEGASKGRGLGDEFLRHVERTRVLVHLVDPICEGNFASEALKRYDVIRQELAEYSSTLVEKPEIVVINKLDVTEVRDSFKEIEEVFRRRKIKVFGISAVSGEGVGDLMGEVMEVLESTPRKPVFKVERPTKVYTISNLPNRKMVFGRSEVLEN